MLHVHFFSAHVIHSCAGAVTAPGQHCLLPLLCLAGVAVGPCSPGVRCRNTHPSSSQIYASPGHGPVLFGTGFQVQRAGQPAGWPAWAACPASYAESFECVSVALEDVVPSHPHAYRAETQEFISPFLFYWRALSYGKKSCFTALFLCASGLWISWKTLHLLK